MRIWCQDLLQLCTNLCPISCVENSKDPVRISAWVVLLKIISLKIISVKPIIFHEIKGRCNFPGVQQYQINRIQTF